jgi:hypothetical protein
VLENKVRDRQKPLKVYVSAEERQKIEALAADCKLSPTAYLRNIGLGYQPKSSFDQKAIQQLAKLHTEQEQLRELLKLWSSEKSGTGARVRLLLKQIETLQEDISRLVLEEARRL